MATGADGNAKPVLKQPLMTRCLRTEVDAPTHVATLDKADATEGFDEALRKPYDFGRMTVGLAMIQLSEGELVRRRQRSWHH